MAARLSGFQHNFSMWLRLLNNRTASSSLPQTSPAADAGLPARTRGDPLSDRLFGTHHYEPWSFDLEEQVKLFRVLERAFDVPVNLSVIGKLIGAPDGAKISAERAIDADFDLWRPYIGIHAEARPEVSGTGVYVELYRAIFHPEIDKTHDGYLPHSDAYCRNWVTRVVPSGTGIGARIFGKQVMEMSRTGIREIRSHAIRSDEVGAIPYNGYYTWAVLGYRMQMNEMARQLASESGFANIDNTHDLFALEGGREFWREAGHTANGVFSLQEGSKSRQILESYLAEKRVVLPD